MEKTIPTQHINKNLVSTTWLLRGDQVFFPKLEAGLILSLTERDVAKILLGLGTSNWL